MDRMITLLLSIASRLNSAMSDAILDKKDACRTRLIEIDNLVDDAVDILNSKEPETPESVL